MKILTAAEMRQVDHDTIERGIPGIILMENAGASVVSYLKENFAPLSRHRVLVCCGKGNNGGDGFIVARLLFAQRLCQRLWVAEISAAEQLHGDAALARKMLSASGCPVESDLPGDDFAPTLVIDAVLGTGASGAPSGRALQWIQTVNTRYLQAIKVAVDFPSGFPTDETEPAGEYVHVTHTVTFTAVKRSQAFSPSYEVMGQLRVYPIGTPNDLCETDTRYRLRLSTPDDLTPLFVQRFKNSNKGMYGHVLVVGGSVGKSGAPAMAGLSALRSGAGLVTVASAADAISTIATASPALMTEMLPQTENGRVSLAAKEPIEKLMSTLTVLALGPGLGTDDETVQLVRDLYQSLDKPMVLDADGLNAVAGTDLKTDKIRILTPHPGEMGRLIGKSVKEVQAARLEHAEALAREANITVVLKGDRTVIAFPDGETWINPTGSPAMATGGTGDILTGLVAGLVGQHPKDWKRAVVAAVWLHGRAGELGGDELGEEYFIATDLLQFLPAAVEECRPAVHQ